MTDIVDSMALESALTPGAVGSGMPTFSAGALTYDGAANEITGDLTNFAAMPPLPSLIVAIMPADIDRQAEDLRMTLNLRDFALQNVAGDPVRARDLTPGCAHLILRSSAGYRLLDPLGPRPQDFDIVVARVPTATATLADLQAILDAAVQFPTNEVVSPPDVVGANNLWFGVPADAPDIDTVVPVIPLGVTTYSVNFNTVVTTLTIGGVLYKWWFGVSWVAGAAMRVIFEEYA